LGVGILAGGVGVRCLRKQEARVGGRRVRRTGRAPLALLAYAASLAYNGNGLRRGVHRRDRLGRTPAGRPEGVYYVEQTAGLASLLVWTLFAWSRAAGRRRAGLAAAGLRGTQPDRGADAPVALMLTGDQLAAARHDVHRLVRPRGLASVVFALLAVPRKLGHAPTPPVAVIGGTVLLSVLAHGFSAAPLATRFGPSLAGEPDIRELPRLA